MSAPAEAECALQLRFTSDQGNQPAVVGVGWYTAAPGKIMAELFVTCPECGLREEFVHSEQLLADPQGQCSHRGPSRCPALRVPLIAARHMLSLLEWDAVSDFDEDIRILPALVEASIMPDMRQRSCPSTASGAAETQPDVEPAVAAEAHLAGGIE